MHLLCYFRGRTERSLLMANPITRYASSNSFGREIGINLTKYGYGTRAQRAYRGGPRVAAAPVSL